MRGGGKRCDEDSGAEGEGKREREGGGEGWRDRKQNLKFESAAAAPPPSLPPPPERKRGRLGRRRASMIQGPSSLLLALVGRKEGGRHGARERERAREK